jgi:hypothetical protein
MVSAFQEIPGWLDWLVLARSQEFDQNIELADQPYYMDTDQTDQPSDREIDLVGPRR